MTETLVRMPKLADTLVEGTIGQWHKQVGEQVAVGEPLASIETDKVTTDLTSPAAGTLVEVLVAEGDTVPVETPIARIGAATPSEGPQPTSLPPVSEDPTPTPSPAVSDGPRPTPVAARMLAEHGLKPTDIGGATRRVTKRAVLNYLNASASAPESVKSRMETVGELVPLSRMRAAIADHMTRAKQTIPHGQTVMEADFTELVAWREQHKTEFQAQHQAGLTFTVLFVAALAQALARRGHSEVHIGIAVALDNGLIVPVLRDADELVLGHLAQAIADLAQRARRGALKPDETQGALMTVSNVGSLGNLSASPIVPLNQIGILGPGLVEQRPLPTAGGGIKPGYRCLLTLMFDRRAMSDLDADRLLRLTLKLLLQLPQDTHGRQHVDHA
jgi:pyruvate/2-oxoglutarate dehydrogenase complex dihydrolipoamide acyltransferase (E2) component